MLQKGWNIDDSCACGMGDLTIVGLELLDRGALDPGRSAGGGMAFQHRPKHESFFDLVERPVGHEGPLRVGPPHQTFGFKAMQGLSHRRPGHAARLCQRLFPKLLAGAQYA